MTTRAVYCHQGGDTIRITIRGSRYDTYHDTFYVTCCHQKLKGIEQEHPFATPNNTWGCMK